MSVFIKVGLLKGEDSEDKLPLLVSTWKQHKASY